MGVSAMELNLEPSENAQLFTDSRYGPATEVVPVWVGEMLRGAEANATRSPDRH